MIALPKICSRKENGLVLVLRFMLEDRLVVWLGYVWLQGFWEGSEDQVNAAAVHSVELADGCRWLQMVA